ncbi:expressed unknown protein [Seminavis robusta]|uniref:VWFD domain-containing protein n=1 Tax=Seminavis robusta TaxID=568900 RepID=A0A9N8HHD1_9STRA|nr:expressed unknown protein [Seminavis robusta]|eukprot:Sro442_g143870.1 n/a (444) ;mRNA; r:25075-26406
MMKLNALLLFLLAAGASAQTCTTTPAPSVSYGSYFQSNPQCHAGGDVTPFGYNYGWKMDGCQTGSFPLDQVAAGSGSEIKGSCPTASDIVLVVNCVGNTADVSWTGTGANGAVLDIKVKGSNRGNLFDGSVANANGGNYAAPANNGGQVPSISHLEICLNCPVCTDPPATDPPPTDGSAAGGDPHIKTWAGEYFDFHGECDLVLAHAKRFDGKQDLDIHARTTIQWGKFSYIESAAVKIGEDVLEVSSWGEYSLNGVDDALPNSDQVLFVRKQVNVATLGGYPIHHVEVDNSNKRHIFDIVLNEHVNITVSSMKHLVSIKINHSDERYLKDVVGLLGDIHGNMLARDGVTSLQEDPVAMGLEWQVRDDDVKLFETDRHPQYPQKCILPEITAEREARRLGEGVTEGEAEVACAHLRSNAHAFANCVYDVTAMNDLELAPVGAM